MPLRRFAVNRFTTRSSRFGSVPRQLLSALGLCTPLLLLAQALTSCGSDDDKAACTAGDIQMCVGPAQCAGEQSCTADGKGFTACTCGSRAGTGGTTMSGNAGASAGGNGGASNSDPLVPGGIGTPCQSDAQCPTALDGSAPLVCILASSNAEFLGRGGPQGGYCSAPCGTSVDCEAIDPISACGLKDPATNRGYCLALCAPGNNPQGKCGMDRAQACVQSPNNAALGACFPACQSDLACGPGRFCDASDLNLGLCVDVQPVGGVVGAPCAEATAATDCASGICLSFPNADNTGSIGSFCSASCTFASLAGCGYAQGSTGPREAACLQERFVGGSGGDLGYCFELCDQNSDCEQSDWVCDPFANTQLQTLVGRQGQCIPAALAAAGALDAGTD
jgi:hypothetical protein